MNRVDATGCWAISSDRCLCAWVRSRPPLATRRRSSGPGSRPARSRRGGVDRRLGTRILRRALVGGHYRPGWGPSLHGGSGVPPPFKRLLLATAVGVQSCMSSFGCLRQHAGCRQWSRRHRGSSAAQSELRSSRCFRAQPQLAAHGGVCGASAPLRRETDLLDSSRLSFLVDLSCVSLPAPVLARHRPRATVAPKFTAAPPPLSASGGHG